MELSKNLLNQIETHKENKPFNPFKIKAWTKIIMPIIALDNNAIKARNAEKQQILKGLEQEIVLSEKILDGLKQLERTQKAKDQHEAEIRATKQAHTATEAEIRTEPPKPQENRLERKSAQSSPIVQDNSISDKKMLFVFLKLKFTL